MHNWLKYTALATVVGLAACTSSPTGRNQLLLFSDPVSYTHLTLPTSG